MITTRTQAAELTTVATRGIFNTRGDWHPGLTVDRCHMYPADICYPTDLSLLSKAREVTEKLIDAMHPPVRDGFGAEPRTHRRRDSSFLLLLRRSGLTSTRFARPSNSNSPIWNET